MEYITLEKTVTQLAQEKKYKILRDIMNAASAFDLADVFDTLPADKRPVLFRLMKKELAAQVFVELQDDIKEQLIRSFSDKELADVLNELYVDDAADLVEEMPANVVKRILLHASPDMRKMINEILRYPEDSAGRIMNTEYISLRATMTAEHAVTYIRQTGFDKETVNTLYVIDKSRKLIGVVSIRALLFSDGGELIENIMDTNAIQSVTTVDDREVAALLFERYDLTELAVTDTEGRLVGIVTVDDAIDVMQSEATEDIEKMAAITPSDKPYLKTSVFETFSKRIPWLLLLMVSATFTGMIISSFEGALAALPALTAFIPMLMDTGGNSGSQASVTVIRGISLNEIAFSDTFKVIFKEFRVSLLCGLLLSAASFAKICLVDRLIMGNNVSISVAFVVSLTLLTTVVAAKLVGSFLPLAAKKVGFDPAVMASPFITTIVDAVSLLNYFFFASILLSI